MQANFITFEKQTSTNIFQETDFLQAPQKFKLFHTDTHVYELIAFLLGYFHVV